ncbi:MAG: hypothetical protein GY941_16455 [Planctomycetes bacterium]|nr:hypothetical protein [Planctomycetota bacterium]
MRSKFRFIKLVRIAVMVVCVQVLSPISGDFLTGPPLANAAARDIDGVLRVHPANPRYFTNNTGKVIYLTGSHTWTNLCDQGTADPPPAFDYPGYLDALERYDHNFIRLWTIHHLKDQFKEKVRYARPIPFARTGPGLAIDGRLKLDLNKFNSKYFNRLRSRVVAARDRGMYVAVMLFGGWALHRGVLPVQATGHWSHPKNNINGINGDPNGDYSPKETQTLKIPAVIAIQKAYIRKVIETINDLDNVLYDISNESLPESKEWQYEMIKFIKNVEAGMAKQHPVGMTSYWGPGGLPVTNKDLFVSNADWVSPDAYGGYKFNPPAADGSKVIILDSDHVAVKIADRSWIWKSFLRGHNPILMDWDIEKTDEPRKLSAREAMGDTLKYAEKMNLAAMTPSTQISSTKYALANPGSEYLIYQPNTGSFKVNLEAGKYDFEWFRPKTGEVFSTGTVNSQAGKRSFTPPFGGTVVLYLKSTSSIE